MYAPSKPGDQPSVEVSKEFMMSPNKLHLECSLDKELYYHGETISVNVHIQVNIERFQREIFLKWPNFTKIRPQLCRLHQKMLLAFIQVVLCGLWFVSWIWPLFLISVRIEKFFYFLNLNLINIWVYKFIHLSSLKGLIEFLICFQNNSNKAVKKIKVSVRQFADICLFSTAQYKCTVDERVIKLDKFTIGSI